MGADAYALILSPGCFSCESAERLRQIARCDAEIGYLESRPEDVPEVAYLVTLGIEDWRAERRLLEAYADRT